MLKPTEKVAVLLSKGGSHYHIGLDCCMVVDPVPGDPYLAFVVHKYNVGYEVLYQHKRYMPCVCIDESIEKYQVRKSYLKKEELSWQKSLE